MHAKSVGTELSTDVEFDYNNIKFDRILMLPEHVMLSPTAYIKQLKHPSSDDGCQFLVDFEYKEIYELNVFDENHRSLFIGNSVHSDGSIIIASKYDVIYLILPYLMKSKNNVPLEQLLEDSQYPNMQELADFIADLSDVAQQKGDAELNVWKYDQELTLNWLEKRARKLAAELQNNDEPTSEGFSSVLSASYKGKATELRYLQLSYGIICEYISSDLAQLLFEHLKLPKPEVKVEAPCKKLKVMAPNDEYHNALPESKTKPTNNAKSQALAKSAKGTKSITSFFKKK